MKKHIIFSIFCMFLSTIILGQTQLQGKVTDGTSGESVLFGTVALYKSGVLLTGTETDLDGNYFFSDLDPGTYDVEVTYVGLWSVSQLSSLLWCPSTLLQCKFQTKILADWNAMYFDKINILDNIAKVFLSLNMI